jgi:hypothetical protein
MSGLSTIEEFDTIMDFINQSFVRDGSTIEDGEPVSPTPKMNKRGLCFKPTPISDKLIISE